jgi:hypothetical protein
MAPSVTPTRQAAMRLAGWLVDKGRPDDAVALLAVWAAAGPNDAEGQSLLAEALRIQPTSGVARLAFKRMEGISDDFTPLNAAITKWSADEIQRLESERSRPSVLRAQVGFNNNVKYKNQTFHIQTEDSGLEKPHIVTHLFADGGRIIKSHRRSYAKEVHRSDVGTFVRQMMKDQQLEMALALRTGRFDAILEGHAPGGIEELDYPPKVELKRLATQNKSRVLADGQRVNATPPDGLQHRGEESLRSYFRLTAVRRSDRSSVTRRSSGDAAPFHFPTNPSAIRWKQPSESEADAFGCTISSPAMGSFFELRRPSSSNSATSSLSETSSFGLTEIPNRTTSQTTDPHIFIRHLDGRRPSASFSSLKAGRLALACSPTATRCRLAR